MSKDRYRPVKSDPEYLDNWVPKFNLLCKRKEEIGFIGSSFFIGIITSILIIPPIADQYGWAQQIKVAIVLQIITQSGLLLSQSIEHVYFFEFILGVTFPGKNIIWFNYA